MTTPASGPITLRDVANELGDSEPITLGQGDVRNLAGVASGPISLGQLRGRSKAVAPPPPPPPTYPAAGTLLNTFCSGVALYGTYANGTGGQYTAIIQDPSTQCGFNPYPAYGTLINTFCTGDFTLWGNFNDGSGGIYQSPIATNSPACGYFQPPPAGQFIRQQCVNYQLQDVYTDGHGGEYATVNQEYSAYCQFLPNGTGTPDYNAGNENISG